MIPREFEYFDPDSLGDAVNLLAQYGEDAKVMAGGQSLLPMMKLRVLSPQVLVDLWRVPDLTYVKEEDDTIRIGALTTHYGLETSALIQEKLAPLAAAAKVVGDPLVRNLGTIGGSAAHAAHNADYPAVLVSLGAEMLLMGAKGTRMVAAADFFEDAFTTVLEADEILTEIRIPTQPEGVSGTYLKLSRRGTDFAIVGVAAALEMGANAMCAGARIVLAGVGTVPVRASEAEGLLQDKALTPELFAEAAAVAARDLDPPSDVHADAQYRREVAEVLVRRALAACRT
jgi:aerobic carbon-monoxide dehydrogenase medium subunit